MSYHVLKHEPTLEERRQAAHDEWLKTQSQATQSMLLTQEERDQGLTIEELNRRLSRPPATQLGPKDETDELIQERKKAHGDWRLQAEVAQKLKRAINMADAGLQPHQREALEMIAVKMSRILCGDADHADHWDDICGYARLGKQGHEPPRG